MDVISHFAARFERTREEELSLEDYLAECKRNPLAYATAAERMLKAIGEPQTIDTRNDQRLSRLFASMLRACLVMATGSAPGIRFRVGCSRSAAHIPRGRIALS